jgi:hypothetical protein
LSDPLWCNRGLFEGDCHGRQLSQQAYNRRCATVAEPLDVARGGF